MNGQVLWASEEPDLLWALRGAGGSFGGTFDILGPSVSSKLLVSTFGGRSDRQLTDQQTVVTSFKLRAYRYTQSIFAGPIYVPKDTLPEIARAAENFTQRSNDGKLGMFLMSLGGTQEMVVIHAFDAHGEEHGRSADGFGWALGLKGAVDETKLMNLRGVADLQGEESETSLVGKNQRLIVEQHSSDTRRV